jgi:hypothetical protein
VKHQNAAIVGASLASAGLLLALGAAASAAEETRAGQRSSGRVKSPLKGVNDEQWKAYLRALASPGHADRVSPKLALGTFFFTYPRLADLGYVRNVRRATLNGRSVWTGDFVPPLTLERFLREPDLQVEAMGKSARDYLPKVRVLFGKYVGQELEGKKATLSGLLAVAHRGGLKGLQGWVKSARDRVTYPNTTAAYNAANGIF